MSQAAVHLPVLIVVVPLAAALLVPLAALSSRSLVRPLTLLSLSLALAASLRALWEALSYGPLRYEIGGWPPPWGIEYVIDPLAGMMAVLITLTALLAVVYSGPQRHGLTPGRSGALHSLFLLLTTGLLGVVVTADVFNLFVFLEISALSVYALVASGGDRATMAAFRYMIIGTVGASFYLLGLGYLYAATGSLNMADLAVRLGPVIETRSVAVGLVLIVVGLGVKTALFPLHGWLPDAYTRAPAPIAAFISGVQTKVAAYALLRILFFVFEARGPVDFALDMVAWAAAAGIIAGSLLALAQKDFRRMLAYSSVAQLGYVALGIALGNPLGLIGALLQVIGHAVTKAALFMVAGAVGWREGIRNIPSFAGLSLRMPVTMAVMFTAAMSMIGLPPTVGFFSKWYLVLGCLDRGAWPFVLVIIAGGLLNALYFFRVIERAYLGRPAADSAAEPGPAAGRIRELPAAMLGPMLILGAAVILTGLLSGVLVTEVLEPSLPVIGAGS